MGTAKICNTAAFPVPANEYAVTVLNRGNIGRAKPIGYAISSFTT